MHRLAWALAVLTGVAIGPVFAAAPPDPAAPTGVAVVSRSGARTVVSADELAALPADHVSISFETEQGPLKALFEGPRLWAVLDRQGAIDATKPREQAHLTVVVAGRDGYTAVLALGEISPAFEAKRVILADRMDGRPLGAEHLRIVVPGDRRGGRSVRDVVRITLVDPGAANQ